jgi:hypothetical protein
MAKKPTEARRKLVEFDAQTWHALNLLSRESMKTFQELADEAFRNLLQKYGRPTDLKAALRESAHPPNKPSAASREAVTRELSLALSRRLRLGIEESPLGWWLGLAN